MRGDVVQRGGVHLGVISNVHEVAVETVRPYGRDERLDGHAAGLRRAGGHHTVAHELEVALELGDVGVRRRFVRYASRVARGGEPARGLDALGHEGEFETQRLVGVPVVIRLVDGREQGAVRFDRGAQLIDWRCKRGRHGDSVHELTQRVSVAAEDCVAGAARGGDGDLRRDIRIAVAIAADPVPKPQRHKSGRDRGRSGGGGGGRDCEFVLERPNERVARSSAGVEQPRLQIPEHGAHLVLDRWTVLPHFRGNPEQLYLGVERLLDLAPLAGRRDVTSEE